MTASPVPARGIRHQQNDVSVNVRGEAAIEFELPHVGDAAETGRIENC